MLQDTVLNTGSSVIYFFLQWLTTVLAVRLANFESAGIYSLTISYVNLFYSLALFGIRKYQISDVDKRFSDGQYFAARLTAVALTVAVFIGSLCFSTMSNYRCLCAGAYMLFKLGEAFSDGYFPLLQLRGDYRRLSWSNTVKGCVSTVAFTTVLYIAHDLLMAIVGMVIGYGACILTLDIPYLRKLRGEKPVFQGCMRILWKCIPLLLVSLSIPAMNYVTRRAVGDEFGDYLLGQYTSLSYIIVVMGTFANAIFIVFIPKVGQWKKEKQRHTLFSFLGASLLLMVLARITAMAVGKLFGELVYSWLFGTAILESIGLLLPLILTSTLLMGKSFFAAILVPLGHRWILLAGEWCGVVLCTASAAPLTHRMGMQGANLSYLLGVVLQIIILGGCALWDLFHVEIKIDEREKAF